jgi:cbb3-type cytochrome oxidase subunit 3
MNIGLFRNLDMFDWLHWFTSLDNSKIFSLILFFAIFCGVLIYLFSSKKRAKRLESYKHIPFQDEPTESDSQSRKVTDNEPKD